MIVVFGCCWGFGLWYICCVCRICVKYINKIKCCGKVLNIGIVIVGYLWVMVFFIYKRCDYLWVLDDGFF